MAKLVEILARELKEWPDCKYGEKIETKALTQDDDGRINTLDSGCFAEQDQFNGGVWSGAQWTWTDLNFERAEDYTSAIVTRAEWQAAIDALYPPLAIKEEWNGEGLPPVGLEVECTYSSWGYWVKGKVLCYGQKMIFMEQESSKGDGKFEGSMNPEGIKFRPIRTPEQIAAEKECAEIKELAMATGLRAREGQMEVARALYKAGYRKQEPK